MVSKIGILTSGGDSPGMNAAIRSVTRSALDAGLKVVGIRDGYKGLCRGDFIEFNRNSVSDILSRGGTILGSARLQEFKREKIQEKADSLETRRLNGQWNSISRNLSSLWWSQMF